MRKKALMKRTAAFLLATTMFVGSTMTAFAEGTTDNEINNYVDELDLSKEYEDSGKAEYHNNEAEKIAENETSIQEMTKQAEIAKTAAGEAENAVEDVKKAVDETLKNMEAADAAVDDVDTNKVPNEGKTVEQIAEDAGDIAEEKVDDLNESIEDDIKEFNEKVVGTDGNGGTQADVNKIAENIDVIQNDKGEVIVGTVTDSDGNAKNITLEEYMNQQAKDATDAAALAKDKLEEAIAVPVDDDTLKTPDEVKEIVKEVIDAANDAKTTADNAELVYKATIDNANKAIDTYNLIAMAYNKPLYGQLSITYSEEDAQKKLSGTKYEYLLTERKEVEEDINEISKTNLLNQKNQIDMAQGAVASAETKLNTAKNAAEQAAEDAEDAKKIVLGDGTTTNPGKVAEAEAAADKVIDYYVSPAEIKLNQTQKDIEKKGQEITDLNTLKEEQEKNKTNAEVKAYNDGAATFDSTKKAELGKAESDAWKLYDETPSWRVLTKKSRKEAYNKAKNANAAYTKENLGRTAVENSQEVKNARTAIMNTMDAISTNNDKLGELQAEETNNKVQLEAAEKVRDKYLEEAAQKATDEARAKFVKDTKDLLLKNSAEINQIDYDKDLNEWANKSFNTLHLIDKHNIRDMMDEKYDASTLQKVFNFLGISQWAVSTEQREAVMNAISDAYKESIKLGYEKMETAEAAWAKADAEAAKSTTNTEMAKIANLTSDISTLNERLGDVKSTVGEAQNKYDTASETLDELKKIVNDNKLKKIDLSLLRQEIAKAQFALFTAYDELVEAKAAAAQAEGYKYWAEKLVKEHYTEIYTQAVKDADGNMVPADTNEKRYDLTDKDVKMHNEKNFQQIKGNQEIEVPYSIYRTYVNAMYEKYQNLSLWTYGKGVSTGESMPTLYWELDTNGNLTGNYYDENADKPSGKYFVGYSFKNDLKTYRIDGVVQEYIKEVAPSPAPSETPSPSVAPETPATPGEPAAPADTTTTTTETVTIAPAPVALAAAPVAVADGPAVLGANRLNGTATDVAVLGATRGTDQAVLGKRRRPATGDNSSLYLWILALTAAVGTAAVAGTQIVKSQKKEQ